MHAMDVYVACAGTCHGSKLVLGVWVEGFVATGWGPSPVWQGKLSRMDCCAAANALQHLLVAAQFYGVQEAGAVCRWQQWVRCVSVCLCLAADGFSECGSFNRHSPCRTVVVVVVDFSRNNRGQCRACILQGVVKSSQVSQVMFPCSANQPNC